MAHLIRDCKMSPEELAERARAIRLEDKAVAAAAGIAENTVSRTFGGKTQPLLITCRAIETAIIADELRLLKHLLGIHGIPADWQAPGNGSGSEPIPAAADGEAVS